MTTCNRVYAINVDFLNDKEAFAYWYDKMPSYRKEKIDSYRPDDGKRLSLGAGIILYKGCSNEGIKPDAVSFLENGKPYIDNKGGNSFEFNLSHSGSVAVGAFSDKKVGIDVEEIKAFKENLINYVFSPKEIDYVRANSRNSQEENSLFTSLWTMKESIMKFVGKGLAMDPKKIFIDQEQERIYYGDSEMTDTYITKYSIDGYAVSVCSECKQFSEAIIFI